MATRAIAAVLLIALLLTRGGPAVAEESAPPDPARIAELARVVGRAGIARVETRSSLVYLDSPAAGAEGIEFRSLVVPIPPNERLLHGPIPWSQIQEVQVGGHPNLLPSLGMAVVGGVIAHLLWNRSVRGLVVEGKPRPIPERQFAYILTGVGTGFSIGLTLNFLSTRYRTVYRAP